jgi:hypothetical protein
MSRRLRIRDCSLSFTSRRQVDQGWLEEVAVVCQPPRSTWRDRNPRFFQDATNYGCSSTGAPLLRNRLTLTLKGNKSSPHCFFAQLALSEGQMPDIRCSTPKGVWPKCLSFLASRMTHSSSSNMEIFPTIVSRQKPFPRRQPKPPRLPRPYQRLNRQFCSHAPSSVTV